MARSTVATSKRIAVYTRVSDQGKRSDEELLSHDIQNDRTASFLSAQGVDGRTTKYKDNSRSGRKMSRPDFDRMMEDARAGKLDVVAVYKLSRLGRNTAGVLKIVNELKKLGVEFVCVSPAIDTSNANGRFVLTIFAALDELQAEVAAEDAAVLTARKLHEGTTTGGAPAVGYAWEVTGKDTNGKDILGWLVRSAEFEAVQVIRQGFASGTLKTTYAVAAALNEAGLQTSHGKTWNPRNARGFLLNPVYTGFRYFAGEKVEGGPLHDAMHGEDVQRVIERRCAPKGDGPKKTRSNGEGFELGHGLLRCDVCGGGMVRNMNTLRCSSGMPGHSSITYEAARDWIVNFAFSAQALGNDAPEYDGSTVKAIRSRASLVAAVEEAQQAVEKAARDLGCPVDDLPASAGVVKSLAKAEDAVTEFDLRADRDGEPTVATRAEYDALTSMAARRDALRRIVSEVVVLKGRQGQRINGKPLYDRLIVKFADGSQVPAATQERTPSLTVVKGSTVETAADSEAVAS